MLPAWLRNAAVGAAVLSSCLAPRASAQWQGPRPPPREIEVGGTPYRPPPPEGRARAEVGFVADVTTTFGNLGTTFEYVLVSPLLRGYWRFAEQWAVSLDYGFAASTGGAGVTSGNPFLAGHYLLDIGDGTLRVGFGVGLPAAGGDLAASSLDESALAIVARLAYDPFLWLPEALSFIVPFRIETYTALLFAAELSVGGLASFAGDGTVGAGFFQLVGELGGAIDDVDVGLRVGATGLFAQDVGYLSTFFEPFLRAHVGAAFLMLRASLPLTNLGERVDAGAWGLHLGFGAELGGEPG